MENQIAITILEQLGGSKFIAMTGSKDFLASEDSLIMTLGKNNLKAKKLSITLTSSDTYTMKFFSLDKDFNIVTKANIEMVYADSLCKVFEKNTGLRTKLF